MSFFLYSGQYVFFKAILGMLIKKLKESRINMFRYVFIFACIFCLGMSAHPVQAGWLDFLFPVEDTGPSPAETLRAPFADEDAVIEDLDASGNRENLTPLHMRHRTNAVITRWVQEAVPLFLTYKGATYESDYHQKALSFSKIGAEEYAAFLHGANFITTLKTGKYNIAGFVQDYPVIVNEGVTDGRYKWLYETNVMVTFLDGDMSGYSTRAEDDQTISREYTVTLQLGRSREAANEHGLLVETWSAKLKK